jgi:xylulokinase
LFAAAFAGPERAAATAAGQALHQRLDDLAVGVPPGANGVRVAPYFLGEKTPIHDPMLRGTFSGLGGSNSRPWMQIVTDVLQAPVRCLAGHWARALGQPGRPPSVPG